MSTLRAPIHREVRVKVTPSEAFDLFTGTIGAWWPRTFSAVSGTLAFLDSQLVEDSDEDSYVWGEVITWNRPKLLVMAWRDPTDKDDQRTNVEIAFVQAPTGTIVRVAQSGWERVANPAAAIKRYGGDRGWREVLDCYETAVRRS